MEVATEAERRQPSAGRRCCRYLVSEVHYSSLCCCYKDQKVFAFSPWLPYKLSYQWLYLIYRWVLALYFNSWLLYMAVLAGQDASVKGKFFIYLTNWGFLFFNAYLLVAALSVSVSVCSFYVSPPSQSIPSLTNTTDEQTIHCTTLSCINGLHWALGIIGLEFAIGITVLFWLFFNDPALQSFTLGVTSVHVHMVNGIIALVDIWITGLPFRILHLVYAVLFASTYVVFTGLYYVAGGTDINGSSSIYPVLNYKDNPELAVGVGISCALLLSIALHLIFYFMYLARYWLSRYLQTRVYRRSIDRAVQERILLDGQQTLEV